MRGADEAAAIGADAAATAIEAALAAASTCGSGGGHDAVAAAGAGVAADDGHHAATAPATRPSATTRKPIDGPQARRSGWWESLTTGRPVSVVRTSGDHGADGLDVDTVQPMRSWPNWFQIGLLPLGNDV